MPETVVDSSVAVKWFFPEPSRREALRLLKIGQAVYDCLYLAVAIRRGCDLITADRRFQSAVQPMFPCVLSL